MDKPERLMSRHGLLLAATCVLASVPASLFAAPTSGSATWSAAPATFTAFGSTVSDWNIDSNWIGGASPNASTAIANFGPTSGAAVLLTANTSVDSLIFASNTAAYNFAPSPGITLTVDGAGITNNSAITQNFTVFTDGITNAGKISFTNSTTAGSLTNFTVNGAGGTGARGIVEFLLNAQAGTGNFTTNGSAVSGPGGAGTKGGLTSFAGTASADHGAFTVNGGSADAGTVAFSGTSSAAQGNFIVNGGQNSSETIGGFVEFNQGSSAGNATLTAGAGSINGSRGHIDFNETAGAGSATLIANGGVAVGSRVGGTIRFFGDSTGGTARVEVFGNSNVSINAHNPGSVTIGSLEGNGNAFIGTNTLVVGSNNLSTNFSGGIQDTAGGGSVVKVGTGTWTLSSSNSFSGGITLSGGALVAAADHALGFGNVTLGPGAVTLTLQTGVLNDYIANSKTLSIASGDVVVLNFTGQSDVVAALLLGGVAQAPGTYSAVNAPSFFSGTGSITVVPEASTSAMLAAGTALLLTVQARRRKRA